MSLEVAALTTTRPIHTWLRPIRAAYVPGARTPLAAQAAGRLVEHLGRMGHTVHSAPEAQTEAIITTARFGEPLGWRESLLFTGRRRYGLSHTPAVFTLIHVTPQQLQEKLAELSAALAQEPLDPARFAYPGLAPAAHRTLIEQGQRGGPMLALIRLLQAQAKSIRIILLVGGETPQAAYYFDLVGAHPRIPADDPEGFYADMALRVVTAVSTREITQHQVVEPLIPHDVWRGLTTPGAMRSAGRQLGRRRFFTEMVRIADLVHVPALADAVASQYSEGCFATWEPGIDGLMATITGSARPVEKENITDDELAVIVGVRPDGLGAVVRHVEGKRNDPPSSEAVELMDLDSRLPRVQLGGLAAPVARSKLHGHRGVAAFDSARVEFVPLAAPYYHYPVSCSTEAQAQAITAAFARSETLRHPADPRTLAFTVLPGHGVVIVEKWVPGALPFQAMWEAMDAGQLVVANQVPQGPFSYRPDRQGRHALHEE